MERITSRSAHLCRGNELSCALVKAPECPGWGPIIPLSRWGSIRDNQVQLLPRL